MDILDWEDRHKAYQALKVTLQALRDHLSVDEVAQLGAQLPMLVRGFYYEGWDPSSRPSKERQADIFLARIAEHFVGDQEVDFEEVARAVFEVMNSHLTEGEIEDVKKILPSSVRALWPAEGGLSDTAA